MAYVVKKKTPKKKNEGPKYDPKKGVPSGKMKKVPSNKNQGPCYEPKKLF